MMVRELGSLWSHLFVLKQVFAKRGLINATPPTYQQIAWRKLRLKLTATSINTTSLNVSLPIMPLTGKDYIFFVVNLQFIH